MTERRALVGSTALVALVLAAVLALPQPARAQSAEELASACATAGGEAAWCAAGAAAARSLTAATALLARPGAEVPGQASTLGRRLGGSPRLAPFVDLGIGRLELPDLEGQGAAIVTRTVPVLHAGIGFGVFEGFSPLPTVGGVLALDVVGQAGFLLFSEGGGFDGRVDGVSVAARLGLLRESFTLPGVTVSVAKRFFGSSTYGDEEDPLEVSVEPSVTSVRATVGKDLFAFGVLFGVGWDDLAADEAAVRVPGAGTDVSASGRVELSRRLWFLGLSRQLGVLSWLSAELGRAHGFDPVSADGASAPGGGGQWFGSLALLFRL